MPSVLQDWVMELPLREQGTLLTGVRGCDLAPKPLLDEERVSAGGYSKVTQEVSVERQLTAFLRWTFMNPADVREVDIPGAFFQSRPPDIWKPSQLMHYPLHWYSHLLHAFEVVGYRHPTGDVAASAYEIYHRLVTSLHLNKETRQQMIQRLSEDRIASGEVVS